MQIPNRAVQISCCLLRVVAGLLLFQIGMKKVFGWYGGMPGGGTAPLLSQIGIGGVLEVIGGLVIMLGLCTRPVAFVPLWADGGGVLAVSRAARRVAGSQSRRVRCSVLLYLSLHGRPGQRRLKPEYALIKKK